MRPQADCSEHGQRSHFEVPDPAPNLNLILRVMASSASHNSGLPDSLHAHRAPLLPGLLEPSQLGQTAVDKMDILWPGFSACLVLISPSVYIFSPSCTPVGGRMFTSDRAAWIKLSGMEVLDQDRGGEETHKHMDVIGWPSASHHREPPPEFLPMLGAEKEKA